MLDSPFDPGPSQVTKPLRCFMLFLLFFSVLPFLLEPSLLDLDIIRGFDEPLNGKDDSVLLFCIKMLDRVGMFQLLFSCRVLF
jgi:hypothetical protein